MKEPEKKLNASRQMLRGTGIVGGLTLVSRVFGLVRDLIIARVIGAGLVSDAFFVAFRIPNLLRSLVAEGALTSAFVPVFSAEMKKEEIAAQKALRATSALLILATTIIALLGILLAEPIITVIAPGFTANPEQATLATTLTRIMMPYIIFVSLVAMINGALNTVGVYGAAPIGQITVNIALIIGALVGTFFDLTGAVYSCAISVIIGGVAEVVVQFPALKRARFSIRPQYPIITRATRQILRLMAPAVLGSAVYQISIFLNTLLASLLQPGAVSWLSYADRIAQLPIGIFSIALASVLLPTLSNAAAQEDEGEYCAALANALRYTSFVMIPLATAIFVYAESLVSIIYQGGAFTEEAAAGTALAVQAMAFGLWGTSCLSMTVRAFLAKKDTRTPAMVGVAGLVISVALSVLLMGPPVRGETTTVAKIIFDIQATISGYGIAHNFGHAGLALAAGLSSTGVFLLLVLFLRKHTKSFSWWPFLLTTVQTILAAAIMYGVLTTWNQVRLAPLVQLLGALPIGAVTFGLATYLLGTREIREIMGKVRRGR